MTQDLLGPLDTESSPFYLRGDRAHIVLWNHSGGVWRLEQRTPDGSGWVNAGHLWNGDSVEVVLVQTAWPYRIVAGDVGASATVWDNRVQISENA